MIYKRPQTEYLRLDEFLSDSVEKISRYMQTLTEEKENHWEKLNRFFLEETGR